jgi:hypothetical protein
MEIDQEILEWLMVGDPAVRWQVKRDLLKDDGESLQLERSFIAEEGWGARFLSYQDPQGTWGGGIYSPKWVSTTYTMLTLKRLGLESGNQQARKGCQQLLERGFFSDGGINYFKSLHVSEVCVTGMVLSILAHFHYPDQRLDDLAHHLLGRQMEDGGWNCEDYRGATHSSFHTTISVLEGLLEYQRWREEINLAVEVARLKAHEFLLLHRLFRSHRTGEIVNQRMLRLPFPPRWFYDFLRALDYFQDYYRWRSGVDFDYPDRVSEKLEMRHIYDERFSDGIDLLIQKRRNSGKWLMMRGPSGKVFFEMEQAGKPSRWNTLRALRVLNWWEAGN